MESEREDSIWSSCSSALRLSFFIFKTGTILITTWHHLQGINEITCVKSLTPDLAPETLATTSGCYYPLILLTRHSQSQISTCCCNTAEGWQLGKLSRFHPRRGSRAEENKLTGMSLSHCGPSFPSLLNEDNFPLCLLSLMKFVAAIQGSQGEQMCYGIIIS